MKKIIKNKERAAIAVTALIIAIALICGIFAQNENTFGKSEPSRTALRCEIGGSEIIPSGYKIKDSDTITATVRKCDYDKAKLVFKIRGGRVDAFTKGKVICRSKKSDKNYMGEYYYIADLYGAKSGDEINLRIIAVTNKCTIESPIYITTINDFITEFFGERAFSLAIMIAADCVASFYFGMIIFYIIKKKKRRTDAAYKLAAATMLALYIFCADGFYQAAGFGFGAAYFLRYFILMSAPIFAMQAHINLVNKKQGYKIMQYINILYCVLRYILFFAANIALDKWSAITVWIYALYGSIILLHYIMRAKERVKALILKKSLGCIEIAKNE